MDKVAHLSQTFLDQLFEYTALDLKTVISLGDDACFIDLEGDDASMLRSEGGELLDALEHLVNQAFGREIPHGQRIVCDVYGFRATRETELQAMAHLAADRVRSSRVPFIFGPMNANERKVIHLALANSEDLQTESVGEGDARRLKVSLKS